MPHIKILNVIMYEGSLTNEAYGVRNNTNTYIFLIPVMVTISMVKH